MVLQRQLEVHHRVDIAIAMQHLVDVGEFTEVDVLLIRAWYYGYTFSELNMIAHGLELRLKRALARISKHLGRPYEDKYSTLYVDGNYVKVPLKDNEAVHHDVVIVRPKKAA